MRNNTEVQSNNNLLWEDLRVRLTKRGHTQVPPYKAVAF
jgi:hypothetical protein